ncbi:hypothetical protein Celaphus_00004054 [Cervus elaphus hippelaphus]|uniref:Uncharacterized protein n=1 Tax=Cervus elaphus hippelaphus TaxID=46360 RepID=A0A212DBT3_CEREH|nr:hypothetical protein Celaphus_00004054 [Cervus elaphus hippelaphus]
MPATCEHTWGFSVAGCGQSVPHLGSSCLGPRPGSRWAWTVPIPPPLGLTHLLSVSFSRPSTPVASTADRKEKATAMPDSPAEVKTQPRATPPSMPPPPPVASQGATRHPSFTPHTSFGPK